MARPSNFQSSMFAVISAIVAIAMCIGMTEAFGTSVVYGPAASELVLLTSKLAAKEGSESFCICAPGKETISRRLMYGTPEKDEEGKEDEAKAEGEDTVAEASDGVIATPISSGEDMSNALSNANTLFLVCYDKPVEESALKTLLSYTGSDMSKVVMLSKMGATSGGGGFFGGGSKLADSEKMVRKLCDSKGLDLSIVRAGTLKGGGPGEPFDLDYGLSKQYYNTLFELSEASCTMSHDRFTLGVDCTKGDTVEMPNAFIALGTKTSFEACAYDTNRINAAKACVMAAKHDKPVEFSVSATKAEEPPSQEEWQDIMAKMEV